MNSDYAYKLCQKFSELTQILSWRKDKFINGRDT